MSKVRLFALGGLDEDGKNMYIVENDEDIFIMECGLKYPGQGQMGIEIIIPDFSYLEENKDRIKAIFITHGHDDVMGDLSHLEAAGEPRSTAGLFPECYTGVDNTVPEENGNRTPLP